MPRQPLVKQLCIFVAAMAGFLIAHQVQAQELGEVNIKAELIAETRTPAPGNTIQVAIAFTPNPGWHGYWVNGGDAGMKPRFDWSLPKGVSIGDARYPVPERLLMEEKAVNLALMNHVYQGPHAFLFPLTVPASTAKGATLPIRLTTRFLACTDKICTQQEAKLSLDIVVGDGAIASADRARFDGWRAALPRPLGNDAHFQREDKTLRLAIPLPQSQTSDDLWFFSATQDVVVYKGPQKVSRNGDMLTIETPATDEKPPSRIEGILALGPHRGFWVNATPGTVSAPADADLKTALLAFLGALVGGLLLNIMPCVFPIISLKALSLARAGGEEKTVREEAHFYSVGTIFTCLALGGLLLALRAGGAAIGWAFQLQDPRVILLLLVLVTLITLVLAGVAHLSSFSGGDDLTRKGGKAGAFWTGALAAFVATPCTGPFMAAALGAALVMPVWAALAIFAGLGLGMAAPFLLIAYVPALRNRLPRPGPWMAKFQRWMAVPMALTGLALLWLLWRQAGGTGALIGLGVALVAAFAFVRQTLLLIPLALVALAVGTWKMPAKATISHLAEGSVAFSEAKLAELRAAKKPVFLYFTADWCLTCKVNEKAAIESEAVAEAFKAQRVTVMVGDWSTPDPAISRFLESQGRSGIPLYLIYRPGAAQPETLPQILTPSMLATAFAPKN